MPFTPFHIGPAILIGLVLRDYIDFPTFVIANLIVDIRATLVLFGLIDGVLHGFLHTFLFGSILGLTLAVFTYHLRPITSEVMDSLRLEQLEDYKSFAVAGALGTAIHTILDSLLYTDIQPLLPSTTNPFYGVLANPSQVVYGFTMISLILGAVLYLHLCGRKHISNLLD